MGQLEGSVNSAGTEQVVTVLESIQAWTGSCVLLPCTYKYKEVIHNFTWYYNPEYDENLKEFKGKVVYNHLKRGGEDGLFDKNVQYVGTTEKDCTVLLYNLTKEHSGQYGLRLKSNKTDYKWMSKKYVNVTVSDSGPTFKIDTVPEIIEFQAVTLTCSINYYCPLYDISLSWIEDVKGQNKIEIRNDTSDVSTKISLRFSPLWTDNNKNITCVFRQGDEEKRESIQLNVKYSPKNVEIWSNNSLEFREGESLTLQCTVKQSNPPVNEFIWYKDGKVITTSTTTSGINVNAPGKYYCEARNEVAKSQSNTVQISRLYPPKEPTISIEGSTLEGNRVTLKCVTSANPPVTLYVWYKDGKPCFNTTNDIYSLNNIKIEDDGNYECEAYNRLGSKISKHFKVDVMYLPKDVRIVPNPDSKTYIEGTKVTFTCKINTSNPEVTGVRWFRNKNLLPGKQRFSEQISVKWEDSGMYSCQAINSMGATMSPGIPVEVLYPPKQAKISISKASGRKEGEQITFKCDATQSKPVISGYEWFKDGERYKSTDSASLSRRITWADSGNYSCRAINSIGNSTSLPEFLNVLYAPRNLTLSISPGNYVTEYTKVRITCRAQANPERCLYSLYRNNRFMISNPSLDLDNIQRSNAGEYHCAAMNDVGETKSEIVHLYVAYSHYTIGIYVSSVIGSFVFLIILVFLIVHFKVWKKNYRRRNDVSSFFVLKKQSPNETQGEQQTPSVCNSTDRLNYSTLQFPASDNGHINHSRIKTNDEDPSAIYSVVKKPVPVAEYENIKFSTSQDEVQDDIHYSVITNLTKEGTPRTPSLEVEYAMLRP